MSGSTKESTYGTAATVRFAGLPAGAAGAVTVRQSGKPDAAVLSQTAAAPKGSCVLPAGLPGGSYGLQVEYSGDGNNRGSSATVALKVAPQPASIAAAADGCDAPGRLLGLRPKTCASDGQSCPCCPYASHVASLETGGFP